MISSFLAYTGNLLKMEIFVVPIPNLVFFFILRFLLQMFIEAKCHDWWFMLSLVLRDSTCLTDFVDDVIKMRDTTIDSLSRIRDGIASLEAWAEQNW